MLFSAKKRRVGAIDNLRRGAREGAQYLKSKKVIRSLKNIMEEVHMNFLHIFMVLQNQHIDL